MRRSFHLLLSRLPGGLLVGVLCALLVSLISGFNWIDGAESGALDRLFQTRGVRAPDPRISLIVADDATVARAGRWPLPRRVYAQVIERLTRAGARVIACDVLFSVPSPSSSEDAVLVRACRESGRVVQAAAFHVPLVYNPNLPVTLTSDRRTLPLRFAIKDDGALSRSAIWASSALPQLQASASAVGHVNVHPELDGTLRRIPHLIRYRDHIYPSLALAATARFLGLQPGQVVGDPNEVRLLADGVSHRAPLDDNGEAWINWAGGNDTLPTYNFNQLLDGEVPVEALKDHLIFIGITAAGAFEHQPTPFSPAQPAVELQANAASDLLQNKPLVETSDGWRFLLLLCVCLLTGVVVAPRRAVGATLWALFILFAVWEVGAFALARGLYIPVVAPILGALLSYSVTIAGNYRREWESNWRSDASVSALARGGALMANGRERESLLGVISGTAREVTGAREVFLLLGDDASLMHPTYAHELKSLPEIARHISAANEVVLWSAGMATARTKRKSGDGHPQIPSSPTLESSKLLEQLSHEMLAFHRRQHPTSRANFDSILAAPLVGAANTTESEEGALTHMSGILIAVGRRGNESFTARDAVLLQTLAEQATLALDNLGYYELLKGRVELANRNLRQAYDVLSGERAKLSEERTKLAAAVQSMESALVISDEFDRAVFDNGMGSSILWDAAPVIGQSVPETLDTHEMPELAALFEKIRNQQDGSVVLQKATTEIVCTSQKGVEGLPTRRVLLAQLTPLVADDGYQLGSMLVVSDVTAERELAQMKSEFVSFVAHELRTPLTSINGFAVLMRLHSIKMSDEQKHELLGSIENQCSRLNRMISDLLEVARLEPGHGIELRLETLDLVALCGKVLNQLEVLIQDPQRLRLQMHCDLPHLWIGGDADRMEQIIINLISNAIKYSPDGGIVTLKLSANEFGTAQLQVTDTGMGMTTEQLEHLFQKYYRTADAQARGIKGTGLGLYLVKQLVEAHGGHIEVSSFLGQGTTFLVTLPQTEEVPMAASSTDLDSSLNPSRRIAPTLRP